MAVATTSLVPQLEATVPGPCAWERAAGQTAHVLSLGEPALQPVLLSHRLALSASSVDVLILCSHICPLPKGGQLGNDDGVVGKTRVPVSLGVPTASPGRRCEKSISWVITVLLTTRCQCRGGGDKGARVAGTQSALADCLFCFPGLDGEKCQ